MKKHHRVADFLFVGGFLMILFGLSAWLLLKTPDELSYSERRELAQKPQATFSKIVNGEFFEEVEDYMLDQFPLRDGFRRIKSVCQFYLLGEKENNGIVFYRGHAAEMTYALSEKSVSVYRKRLDQLRARYFDEKDVQVYHTVIPDKMAYFGGMYPTLDYGALQNEIAQSAVGSYIDIFDCLDLDAYYQTDTHWKQGEIIAVANRLLETMGAQTIDDYTLADSLSPFYGVYYGQSALPLPSESIDCVITEQIGAAHVWRADRMTGELTEGKIYYEEYITANDAYDVFLGGACTVIEIDNTLISNGKTLYLFSDSFGRSLAPLLLSDYDRVVVYDIRYADASRLLAQIPLQDGSDVLIAYSVSAIDVSSNLRTN